MRHIANIMMLTTCFLFVAVTEAQSNEGRITVSAMVVSGLSMDITERLEGVESVSSDELQFTLRGDYDLVLELESGSGSGREYITIHRDQFYTITGIRQYSEITIRVVSH